MSTEDRRIVESRSSSGIAMVHKPGASQVLLTIAPRVVPRGMRTVLRKVSLTSTIAVVFVVCAWVLLSIGGYIPEIPSPSDLGGAIRDLVTNGYGGYSLWANIGFSVARCMTGFVLGVCFGVFIGLAMGTNHVVRQILTPFFSFLRPIPLIAFIPLFIGYFGIGELPKVLVIFMAAFWFVVLNTEKSVATVSHDLILVARNLGMSRITTLRRVILPGAMPGILAGIRVGGVMSWALVVTAELIGAQVGLGHIISDASTYFQLSIVYVGIAIIGLIGLIIEACLTLAEKRLLHWVGR